MNIRALERCLTSQSIECSVSYFPASARATGSSHTLLSWEVLEKSYAAQKTKLLCLMGGPRLSNRELTEVTDFDSPNWWLES
jgi:hypothetical protein